MESVICAPNRLIGYQLTFIKDLPNTAEEEHITDDSAPTDKQSYSIKKAAWH